MQWEEIIKDQDSRIEAGRQSILAFGFIYLSEYFGFKSPDYQKEYTKRLQNDLNTRMAECDYRESGKSVLTTLLFVLWNICYNKRKFIIIGSETATTATVHLSSLINALQSNEMIIRDFGELYVEIADRFSVNRKKTVSDFITTSNIRVMAKGKGDNIRGLRHLQYRPDLFVGDDLDSLKTVLNLEQRDKTFNWLMAEVLSGLNQEYGKVVVIGNMIHFDCIMARLKSNQLWDYNEVPIYAGDKLAWPARHFWTKVEAEEYNKNIEEKEKRKTSIEAIKEDKGSLIFAQEYLLQPMAESERLIRPEWIIYGEVPKEKDFLIFKARIDPAAKEKETSDYSAIVVGCRDKRNGRIYICDAWQKKTSEKEKIKKVWEMHNKWNTVEFGVEDNAYQEVLKQGIDDLASQGKYVPTKGITTLKDKVSRTLAIQPYIERGDVIFVKNINEVSKVSGDARSQGLIDQMTQFPLAPNDDLHDACVGVIERLIKTWDFKPIETDYADRPEMAGVMSKEF